jgi:hypothetical protein
MWRPSDTARPGLQALKRSAVCLALLTASPAYGQAIESSPLSQLDPWGVGWLGQAQGALPASIWSGADRDQLNSLMTGLNPTEMSPALREALRRVLMSAARSPEGGEALIWERIRLLEATGRSREANRLRETFPETEWGRAHLRQRSEADLAAGAFPDACERVAQQRADDTEWLPLRALCLALANDFNAAAAAAEHSTGFAAGAWLIAAIETMREPVGNRPEGRFSTPLETAISVAAGLKPPRGGMSGLAADTALAIARRAEASPELRRSAARRAAFETDLSALDVRGAFLEPTAASDPWETAFALALSLSQPSDASSSERLAAFSDALRLAGSADTFMLTAKGLSAALAEAPTETAGGAEADRFARACLIAGNSVCAETWKALLSRGDADGGDTWAAARIDLLQTLMNGRREAAGEALARLVASETAPGAAAKAQEARRTETSRALFLSAALDVPLTPQLRRTLGERRTAGRGISDAQLVRLQAAVTAGATAESVLLGVSLASPDPSAVSFAGLADILTQLRRAGLEQAADAIAIEALQPWKGF